MASDKNIVALLGPEQNLMAPFSDNICFSLFSCLLYKVACAKH